jgi:hypothetical protein
MKRLLLSLPVLLIVVFGTTSLASAHVLKQDNGIDGILHIPPEDNPEAGQPTEMDEAFSDQQNRFSLPDCDCMMSVMSNGKVLQKVALQPYFSGSTLDSKATVQFPSIGIYNVSVTGSAKDHKFPNFTLDYLVRVAVNANGTGATANDGGDVLIIGVGALAILGLFAYTGISAGERYKKKGDKS